MKKTILTLLLMTAFTTLGCLAQTTNPLLEDWKTPPFSRIKNEHYAPALRAAMQEQQQAVQQIVDQRSKPTFDNTILALELSGERLELVCGILFNINECYTNDELQNIVMELTPELTRHQNGIMLNDRLFARVKTLYDKRERLGLNAEQLRLLEQTYKGFARSGALLGKKDKQAYAAIEEKLAQLQQEFSKHVLADDNDFVLQITKQENLKGLPQSSLDAAKREAESRNLQGYVFTLKAPSYRPFMTYSENRDLRRLMWTAYNTRGNHDNDNNNTEIVRQIVSLRQQKARLLGYNNYASYVLDDRMAGSTEKVQSFIQELFNVAGPVAKTDYINVQMFAAENGFTEQLMPWDYSYWTERLKQQKYSFDEELLRPYFPVDSVKKGIFGLYGRLYGLTFKENNAIEVYQPDVTVYEVMDGDRLMGILYLDLYPNAGKSGGAWKTDFRSQSNLPHFVEKGTDRPLIQIVCNFTKPVGDAPALLSFDELETFMHEFGHAIHNLLSDVTYPSLSGTAVQRDFVELPSQIMENWCYEQEFLNTFARHYQTGETIPAEYIAKIKAAKNFQSGWYCIRQLNFGLTDLAFHTLDSTFTGSVDEFEAQHTINYMPVVPGTCFSTAFGHIFSGGYASGYYGYKWAEVLDADCFSRFQENGIFDRATAQSFRDNILSKGGTLPAAEMFRNFMGRDPNPNALAYRSGFLFQRDAGAIEK